MASRIILSIPVLLSLAGLLLAQTSDPAREFLNGHRTNFSTKGHPKAKGVNFTIAYPNTWAAAEGKRPNIVQKFVSEGGSGLESAMITTKELPLPPGKALTENDLKEIFTPSELREMLPSGAVFVDAQSTKIEAVPAGILEYTMRAERTGMTFLIHAWALNFLSDKTFVQVQFQIIGVPGSERELSRRMAAFKPLFFLMANSIVFPDKWTAVPKVPATDLARSPSSSFLYDDPGLLILTLIVSFIVTWSVGLMPPLLIRYAFLRRPLSKKTASWVAAGFSVFFWMAFLALNAALGEKPGTGVVWVIMFFVSRWIMSRGHVTPFAAR